MSKLYVKEIKRKNADGDRLITVKTYFDRPKQPFYIIEEEIKCIKT